MTKKKKENKNLRKNFRCTEQEWNRIGIIAKLYAGGNRSKWIVYAAMKCPRKYLIPKEKR